VCFFQGLSYLELGSNLVNHVPREISRLDGLIVLGLENNKLWYLNQVVALKDLVKVRATKDSADIVIRL